MYGLSLNITDQATPVLERIHATLADRLDINQNIGAAVETLCKRYVQADADNHHATANALGADPTGYLQWAIQAITFQADAKVIIVDFAHPWFARVGHDVHIAPGAGKKFLAIPIGADAYGKRLQGQEGGAFFKGPSGALFWGRPYPGNAHVMQPLYVLRPFVDQKQDRSRLPSDQEILDCVNAALIEQIEQRLRAINTLNP